MRVIIAGGRDFRGEAIHERWLDALRTQIPITQVVSGGARGADAFGEAWAAKAGIPFIVYPAGWEKHGRAAGPIRNRQMAENADALVAFPGGRGTANMIQTARTLGLTVHVWPR